MTAAYSEPAFPLRSSNEQHTVLTAKFAIGSTGAVGVRTGSKNLTLTRDGVGLYTLQVCGSAQVAAAPKAIIHATVTCWVNDTDPSNDTAGHATKHKAIDDSAGTMTFQAVDEAMVVRELPSGAVVSCLVVVANVDV